MSDTPETDAAAYHINAGPYGEVVNAEVARKLERERNEARGEIARLKAFVESKDWVDKRRE